MTCSNTETQPGYTGIFGVQSQEKGSHQNTVRACRKLVCSSPPFDPGLITEQRQPTINHHPGKENTLTAHPVRLNPSVHSTHQEIYHDSNVDSKASEKPATMIDASGQICSKNKLQSPFKSPLTAVESARKALCYLLGI
jgi:hypothetical protein